MRLRFGLEVQVRVEGKVRFELGVRWRAWSASSSSAVHLG